ncbi:hypothetical protein [Paeniglutamicibacter sp. NPDC091659]|uniref:hypothetical protein n=1 Tax=Paeniglutamicibacter sp. NPDC091659 TaxID=3364389 RepID=UPI0038216FBA
MTTVGDREVPSVRQLLQLSVTAMIVGVVSTLGLFLVDDAAHYVEEFLWVHLPQELTVPPDSR